MKDDCEIQRWNMFMDPLAKAFIELASQTNQMVGSNNSGGFAASNTRDLVITLSRDLRGIASATSSSESYNMLFNWLVNSPSHPGASRVSTHDNYLYY